MSIAAALIVQFALLSPAMSQPCRVENGKIRDQGPNFTIVGDQPKIKVTAVMLTEPPMEVRQAAASILRSSASAADYTSRAHPLLVQNGTYLLAMRTHLNALAEVIVTDKVDHVAVDAAPELILNLERDSWDLLANGLKLTKNEDEIENLLMLAVGPVVAMRVRHANLFMGVRLEGLPELKPGKPAPAKVPQASSEDVYQNTLEKLERSKSSRRDFIRMAAQLKKNPRPFRGLSQAETKERLLDRFWRPAQRPVGEWIDAFYASRPDQLPAAQAGGGGLSSFLLNQAGTWIVYLNEIKFKNLQQDFTRLCKLTSGRDP